MNSIAEQLKRHPLAKGPTPPDLWIVRETMKKRIYTVVAHSPDHAVALAKMEFVDWNPYMVTVHKLHSALEDEQCGVSDIYYHR